MRVLIDTSILVEGERRQFDLAEWALAGQHEVFICDATVTEYLAGKPVKDIGKENRWKNFWESFVSLLISIPLDRQVCEKAGELLAAARRKGLTVITKDVDHFTALGVRAINPLK